MNLRRSHKIEGSGEYTMKAAYTSPVSSPPKVTWMKLQSITSTNDSPVTLIVPSPPESVKPVCDMVEPS